MGTLAAQITPDGISAPDKADVVAQLQSSFWQIFGSDAVLDDDSQDGQLLGVFAQAITDLNDLAIATYNAFSPSSAQGAGLASVVKINGLTRDVTSNSTAIVSVAGAAGTTINNGLVGDNLGLGTQWALPTVVTIPDAGTIDVTVTATAEGAVAAAPGSLTRILSPTLGWQSVTNADAAEPGNPIEDDADLRRRQAQSVANPSQTVLGGIKGSVAGLSGVGRVEVYENDTDAPDGNGIAAHTIAVVVAGGDATDIATTIALHKTPGGGTAGTVTELVIDSKGVPSTIRFYPLTNVALTLTINLHPLAGYVSTTGDAIKAAIAAFLNGLDIGEDSYLNRLWAPANLSGDAASSSSGQTQTALDGLSKTFNLTGILQSRAGPPAAADVAIAFNEAATCDVANITLNLV